MRIFGLRITGAVVLLATYDLNLFPNYLHFKCQMCAPNHFVHTDFGNVAHAAFFYMVHKCTTIVFTRLQIAKHENRVMHLSRFGSKPNPASTSSFFKFLFYISNTTLGPNILANRYRRDRRDLRATASIQESGVTRS